MARPSPLLKPRKTPLQARSTHTVEVIFDACIHVLLDGGIERLTTTRVAERAGVSIGSLYQYFPNKQSLLAAVLERHLRRVVEAVEQACSECKGSTTDTMAATMVDAFLTAKLGDAAASSALYAVAAEVGGMDVVARLTQRSQLAICDMLATTAGRRFTDPAVVGFVVSTALVGPVQALLAAKAPPRRVTAVRSQLKSMVAAYLRAAPRSPR
jgi:AcrR family transcriptional regulator